MFIQFRFAPQYSKESPEETVSWRTLFERLYRPQQPYTPSAPDTLAWIIHDFTGEKRKDALKGLMNTGFWRTRHSLSEHPRDDILLYTTAVFFLLPTPTHSS
jgi:hypothetical protein